MATDIMRANIARGLIGGVFTLVAAGVSFVLATWHGDNESEDCDHPDQRVERTTDQRSPRPIGPGGRGRGSHWRGHATLTPTENQAARTKPAGHAEPENEPRTSSTTSLPSKTWVVPKTGDPTIDPRARIAAPPKIQPIRELPSSLPMEARKRPTGRAGEHFERR
jgi:hypothetical protein